MIKKTIGSSFLVPALLGCENDKDSANSKYSGIWHEAGNQQNIIEIMNGVGPTYIEITDNRQRIFS